MLILRRTSVLNCEFSSTVRGTCGINNLPPFDKIKDEHFQPALDQGITEEEKEADTIAKQTEKPTFENTIVALEKSGLLLARARRVNAV